MARRHACIAITLAAVFGGCIETDPTVDVVRDGATIATYQVEIARTAADRRAGLRGRSSLASDEGLLIVFPTEGEVCITNAGVKFAIQVVAIDAAATVTASQPLATDSNEVPCFPEVQQVLELVAGADVRVGDQLVVKE